MPIPLIIDNLENAPEEARGFYKENAEGKFEIDPESIFTSFTKVQKALGNERKVRTDYESKFNQANQKLETIDIDDYKNLQEQAKKWNEEKENKERQALEEKGKYEEALNNLKESNTKTISELKADYENKISELNGKLEKSENSKQDYILNDQIRKNILKSGVFAEDVEDVLTLTKSKFSLDDKLNVVIKDESGSTTSETIENFFNETFKKAKPKFYQGNSSSGSGSSAGNGNSNFKNNEELSSIEKISAGLSKAKK